MDKDLSYINKGEKMKIEINIPKAFEKHFNQDKFKYSFDNFLREYNSELLRIANQVDISYEYDDVCEWIKYDYRTICPKNHDANNPYWRIPDNMDKLKYCPHCGKKIKVVE